MKKRYKILTFVFLSLMIMPSVLAATQGYVSTISISSNSTLTGASRSYDYNNHKITIDNPTINYNYVSSGLVIAIYKDGLFSNTQYSRKIVTFYDGESKTVTMGAAGSGKRYYRFGTYQNALKDGDDGHGAHFPGLSSDNVSMVSYTWEMYEGLNALIQ